MLARISFAAFGYLCGSVSFAYLAGRLLRGIDLRRYGSHTLGGSNVGQHISRLWMIVVGLLDVSKAALPTWLALHLGLGLATALAAGVAAILGHNWSLFIGFKGGRGISTCLGVLLVAFPWGVAWILGFMAIGFVLKLLAIFALFGFLTLPFLAQEMSQPPEIVMACAAMLLITIIKRLEGNREPLPAGRERRAALARRLFLDRDIASGKAWVEQQALPDSPSGSQGLHHP